MLSEAVNGIVMADVGTACIFSSQPSIVRDNVTSLVDCNAVGGSSCSALGSPCSSGLDVPSASTSYLPANFTPRPIPAHLKRFYTDGLSYTESVDDFNADKFSRDLFVSSELFKPQLIVNGGDYSEATSSVFPFCRICHQPGEEHNSLISPCRCTGTLQYIHAACLKKWLEVSSKKSHKHPKCELCHFQYHRHKKFKFHHLRLPRVSVRDKVLHFVFFLNLLIMISCAIATVLCFLTDQKRLQENPNANKEKVDLAPDEIVTLTCGVVFFVSFFIAMTVQIKAKHTVYQLFAKIIMRNMEWEIEEYDMAKDSLHKGKPGSGAFV